MIGESVKHVYSPALEDIIKKISKLAKENRNVPMLARTHGQPASPTTFGKEFKVFEERLKRQFNQLKNHRLEANLYTTQIEPHDSYIELFDILRRVNNIIINFNQDLWRYISDDWITQKPVEGEIGSSTMPHKINPWFLENSEGNLGLANALFEFLGRKLPISRLQRDLSDSTGLRNIGVAFSHSLIGVKYLNNHLGRIVVNKEKVLKDLYNH